MELEAEGIDPLAPAKLVRWVQIRVTLWFQRQYRTSESLPPPNFLDLFDLIQEMREWKPPLPQRYLASPPVSTYAASSGTMAIKGKASSVIQSAVATPSGAATSGANAGGRRERVTSATYLESEFNQFKESGLSMRAVRETAIAADNQC